jgi:hypothetical protein
MLRDLRGRRQGHVAHGCALPHQMQAAKKLRYGRLVYRSVKPWRSEPASPAVG